MDEKYIAYQSMVAAREAATWAFWTCIVTASSAFATIATLCLAYKALSTWREQEKTRVKSEFRRSIMKLKTALLFMPLMLDPSELEQERDQVQLKFIFKDDDLLMQRIEEGEQNVKKFDALMMAYELCHSSWLATEHIFDNTGLSEFWTGLEGCFYEYTSGQVNKTELMQFLNNINELRFVFDSK